MTIVQPSVTNARYKGMPMKSAIAALQDLFLSGTPVSGNELTQFFDQVNVPDETGWRAIFKAIFDESARLQALPENNLSIMMLKPVVEKALGIIETADYSEASVYQLLNAYNSILLDLSQQKFKETVLEIATLTNEFKTTCLRHQKGLEKLEQQTLETISSEEDGPEQVIQRIRLDFQALIKAFRSDISRLDNMSHTDYLTGLFNRRFFDKQLYSEAAEALGDTGFLNLLMIDIDDFKRFNDTYGHVIGDQALKAVALKIRTVSEAFAGESGTVFYPARYGGEEFCVIMPGVDLKRANDTATAIKNTIGSYNFVIRNAKGIISGKNIRLTVSVGLARFRHSLDIAGIKQLVSDADQAMYEAKKAGKNCVRISRV